MADTVPAAWHERDKDGFTYGLASRQPGESWKFDRQSGSRSIAERDAADFNDFFPTRGGPQYVVIRRKVPDWEIVSG